MTVYLKLIQQTSHVRRTEFCYKYRFSLKILQIDDLNSKAIAVHQKVL